MSCRRVKERVAVGQCRQRRDDLQPGGDVDQRVSSWQSWPGHVAARRQAMATASLMSLAHNYGDRRDPAGRQTRPTLIAASASGAGRRRRGPLTAAQARPGRQHRGRVPAAAHPGDGQPPLSRGTAAQAGTKMVISTGCGFCRAPPASALTNPDRGGEVETMNPIRMGMSAPVGPR